MRLWALIWQSLFSRRLSVVLTLVTLALSVALFLSVTRLQNAARNSFERSIAGVDLIVSARASDLQVLLYSVFRLGDPINNLSWESFEQWSADPRIAWSVPISLGDSHRGFRVMGTTNAYFDHVLYGNNQSLAFASGKGLDDLFDVVLGAGVAQKLGYGLNDRLVVSHGTVSTGNSEHDDLPFRVSGILEPTGTSIDQTLLVSLEAIEAIHLGWQTGRKLASGNADQLRQAELQPTQITAAFVGLNNRLRIFHVQRAVNSYDEEALTAVVPGVAFARLWSIVGVAEQAFRAIAVLIVVLSILAMITMILTTLSERRREMAIYRSLGATPLVIAMMLLSEALVIAFGGCLTGWLFVQATSRIGASMLQERLGLLLPQHWLTWGELWVLLAILASAGAAAIIPAALVYRSTLADGLTVRS